MELYWVQLTRQWATLSAVYVLCSPAPRLSWSRRRGSLPSRGRYSLPADRFNSVLELYNVQPSDSGDYICTATNSQATRRTTITLDVQGTGTVCLSVCLSLSVCLLHATITPFRLFPSHHYFPSPFHCPLPLHHPPIRSSPS